MAPLIQDTCHQIIDEKVENKVKHSEVCIVTVDAATILLLSTYSCIGIETIPSFPL